jgi:hypothetical protein
MNTGPGSVHIGTARRSRTAWDAVSAGPRGGDGGSVSASAGGGAPLAQAGFSRPLPGGVLSGAGAILAGVVILHGGGGAGPTHRAISIAAGGQWEAALPAAVILLSAPGSQADTAQHITRGPGLSLRVKGVQCGMSMRPGTLPMHGAMLQESAQGNLPLPASAITARAAWAGGAISPLPPKRAGSTGHHQKEAGKA